MSSDEILNARRPEDGVLFGGQPTEAQLRALADAGVRVVIDLRGEAEPRGFDQAALLSELGLEYVVIPFTQQTLGTREPFDRFLQAFAAVEGEVLVHCASGDRVGAAYYAFLVAERGLPREEALERAREAGLRTQMLVQVADRHLAG